MIKYTKIGALLITAILIIGAALNMSQKLYGTNILDKIYVLSNEKVVKNGIKESNYKEQENIDKKRSLAMSTLKKVVKSECDFYNVDDKVDVRLNKFDFVNGSKLDKALAIKNFSVIDLDGDEIPEVVLFTDEIQYEILQYDDNKVYGYNIFFRELMNIKIDGTFSFSGGASDSGFGRMIFSINNRSIQNEVYSESHNIGDKNVISYFKNQLEITESDYFKFIDEQNKKEDIKWYDFTVENIEKVFSME